MSAATAMREIERARLESSVDELVAVVGVSATLQVLDDVKFRLIARHPDAAEREGWIAISKPVVRS